MPTPASARLSGVCAGATWTPRPRPLQASRGRRRGRPHWGEGSSGRRAPRRPWSRPAFACPQIPARRARCATAGSTRIRPTRRCTRRISRRSDPRPRPKSGWSTRLRCAPLDSPLVSRSLTAPKRETHACVGRPRAHSAASGLAMNGAAVRGVRRRLRLSKPRSVTSASAPGTSVRESRGRALLRTSSERRATSCSHSRFLRNAVAKRRRRRRRGRCADRFRTRDPCRVLIGLHPHAICGTSRPHRRVPEPIFQLSARMSQATRRFRRESLSVT
jgi:hypothetical protein